MLADQTIVKTLSPEAHQTAQIFWRDFAKSGINLAPEQRQRFVSLSSEILVLGRSFLNEANATRPPATLMPEDLRGGKSRALSLLKLKSSRRNLQIYPGSTESQLIMQSPSEEAARRKLYLAAHSSTPEQLEILDRLLRARAELSRLVGRESYAHMVLEDKMAKSPGQQHLSWGISCVQTYMSVL